MMRFVAVKKVSMICFIIETFNVGWILILELFQTLLKPYNLGQ